MVQTYLLYPRLLTICREKELSNTQVWALCGWCRRAVLLGLVGRSVYYVEADEGRFAIIHLDTWCFTRCMSRLSKITSKDSRRVGMLPVTCHYPFPSQRVFIGCWGNIYLIEAAILRWCSIMKGELMQFSKDIGIT